MHFAFEVVCQSLVLGLACMHLGIVLVVEESSLLIKFTQQVV